LRINRRDTNFAKSLLIYKKNMLVFPLLNTSRLKLRKLTPDDFESLVQKANNKKISDEIINIPYPYELHHAVHRMSYVVKGFEAKTRFVFAIALKSSNELIGEISLHLENENKAQIGYWVAESEWNKGYASEAISAMSDFGFTKLDLHMIYATCSDYNLASISVLLKNRFAFYEKNNNIHTYIKNKGNNSGVWFQIKK
ncbi:MAG: hypothetical protein RLZZ546_809, partial [Bacteroidota bacterium]